MNLTPTAEDYAVDLMAVLELAEKATPGPWCVLFYTDPDTDEPALCVEFRESTAENWRWADSTDMSETDAEFIVAARGVIPAVIRRCLAAEQRQMAAEEEATCQRERAEKTEAFKRWVHDYLDAHGVPHHPPGTHGAAGCRIGDRMDWLMAKLAAAEAEVARLREAIRQHHAQKKDDRCHLDDDALYAAAGLESAETTLPPKCEFLESCSRYWEQRQRPEEKGQASGKTMAQLESEVARLRTWLEKIDSSVTKRGIERIVQDALEGKKP